MTAGKTAGARWTGRTAAGATLLLIAALAAVGGGVVRFAPAGHVLESLELRAGPTPLLLDAGRLGRPPEGAERVLVRFVDGRWEMANDAPDVPVRLGMERDDRAFRIGRPTERPLNAWRLAPGDRIAAGTAVVRVTAAGPASLALASDGLGKAAPAGAERTALWSDGHLATTGGLNHSACSIREANVLDPLVVPVRSLLAGWFDPDGQTLFTLGGEISGPGCWAFPGVPARGLRIRRYDGAFWVQAGPGAGPVTVTPAAGGPAIDLSRIWQPLGPPDASVATVVIGRTRYAVDAKPQRLRLTRLSTAALLPSDTEAEQNDVVDQALRPVPWIGAGPGPATLWEARRGAVSGLLALCAVTVLSLIGRHLWRGRVRDPARPPLGRAIAIVAGALLLGGSFGLLLFPGAQGVDRALPLAMVPVLWSWATLVQAAAGRLRGPNAWLWPAASLLVHGGLVVQLQLAAGSGNEMWLAGTVKLAAIGGGLALAAGLLALPRPETVAAWAARGVPGEVRSGKERFLRTIGLALLVGLFLLHGLVGSEEGLAGILQTSEVAKLAILLMLAHIGTWYMHHLHLASATTRWWSVIGRLCSLAGLLTVAMAAAMASVGDLSPLGLLGLSGLTWLAVLAGHAGRLWRRCRPRTLWALLPFGLLLTAFVSAWVLAGALVPAIQRTDELPVLRKVAERIEIWLHPELHPVTAYQVLTAFNHIAKAPLFAGTEGLLDGGPPGPPRAEADDEADPETVPGPFGRNGVLRLQPEIENDFVGVAVLSRFGLLPGLLLMLAQIALVAGLFEQGRAALARAAPGSGASLSHRRVGTFLGLALIPFSIVQGLHFVISWGNVFGFTPVVGQPMSWISLGTSHALFFAGPGILLALAAGAVTQAGRAAS